MLVIAVAGLVEWLILLALAVAGGWIAYRLLLLAVGADG